MENDLYQTPAIGEKRFIIQRNGKSGMLYFEGYNMEYDSNLWTADISAAFGFINKEMADNAVNIYKTKGEVVEHQF